eukprot:Colp12_sorted_trinity150504_noHs@31276
MFGCIVAGRLVQTECVQVDPTHFLFTLPDGTHINHIVVFMLGTTPFPEGYGASVYFNWPTPEPAWQYLGYISNEKPSAIFKISGVRPKNTTPNPFGTEVEMNAEENVLCQIGLSIETLDALKHLSPPEAKPSGTDGQSVAEKVATSVYNYVMSFAGSAVRPGEQVVPLSAVENWYKSFSAKLQADPNYLAKA